MSDGTLTVIPIQGHPSHPLGRRGAWHDPRNRLFRALPMGAEELPPRTRLWWRRGPIFDQGNTPSCTAHAALGVCRTFPNRLTIPLWDNYDTFEERVALYKAAQFVDPWPGENYEGSSTDAPFKVLRDAGVITGWRWLFGESELRYHLMHVGPAAIGTEWYNSMFYPDKRGYANLDLGSGLAGGHAYSVVGYSLSRDAYRIVNSWGEWGQHGRVWMASIHVAELLSRDGEAVTVTQ